MAFLNGTYRRPRRRRGFSRCGFRARGPRPWTLFAWDWIVVGKGLESRRVYVSLPIAYLLLSCYVTLKYKCIFFLRAIFYSCRVEISIVGRAGTGPRCFRIRGVYFDGGSYLFVCPFDKRPIFARGWKQEEKCFQ